MKKLLLTALLAALLLLPACAQDAGGEPSEVLVYHIIKDEAQTSGELVRAEGVPLTGLSAIVAATNGLTREPASPELRNALPDGVTINSVLLEGGIAYVDISEGYLELSPFERTLVNCCIALTYCGIDGVASVTVLSDFELIVSGLTGESVMLYDTESSPYEKRLRLYFADASTGNLRAEFHTLTVDTDKPLARYVVEELLRGPYDEGLYSAIPEGTELLSIDVTDGLCTVNLSAEFSANRPEDMPGARLAVYSIVNSLTSLTEVDAVQFTVEGAMLLDYGFVSMVRPLERSENLIG